MNSLLLATVAGNAAIDAYEMDLLRIEHEPCGLVLNAHEPNYADTANVCVMLAATDVTAARLAERLKDDLVREKQILLQELQHRVANSLQIIASVLLQSARRVQSEETRTHLNDAHHRVMSTAMLQKQLAPSRIGEVELRSYFADLCRGIGASMIRDHDCITLTTTVDGSKTSASVSMSLGPIVTALVINALKHAFPGHSQIGKITVDYRSEGLSWTMTVGDDGIGLPADHASMKPGLGTGSSTHCAGSWTLVSASLTQRAEPSYRSSTALDEPDPVAPSPWLAAMPGTAATNVLPSCLGRRWLSRSYPGKPLR